MIRVAALWFIASLASAATLPTGFSETRVTGLTSPTAMALAPDGRIFVCQQAGQLRVIKDGALLPTPFVSLTVSSSGERGLLGIAFDPNFTSNQYVYLYYTATTPNLHNRISRFTANGDVAAAGSEVTIMDLDPLSAATNHNGGAIHFGADGKLYVAIGDNASGANAQSMSTRHGKILRLNSDGTIPTDNPFFGTATGDYRSIWALGLRNPFTFAFQPATQRMLINDVGQNTWEEINDGIAGSNYGWPATEGVTTNPAYRSPLFVYGHGASATTGCAITGGAFYNPSTVQFPSTYVGKYFFADYCSNWIRLFNPADGTAADFAANASAPVDLRVSPDGSLYYLARGNGSVYRVVYDANASPAITQHPANVTAAVGQPATFTCAASGASPMAYRWQRNQVDISGATSSSYTISSVVTGDNGALFRCVATNSFGSATSNDATLTVTTNTPPQVQINSPASGTTYAAGNIINFSASATDAQDGTVGAGSMSWSVDFHHDTHTHPFLAPQGGNSGSFTIPQRGETATNVWYRIYATAVDSAGASTTVFRDLTPRLSTLTLISVPAGLRIALDGQPVTAPSASQSVVGMIRSISAITPQVANGRTWIWSSWSDSGAATHEITTPATNSSYTATFTEGSTPVADFDGDGDADLVWRNQSTGMNTFWLMNQTVYASGAAFLSVTDVNWQITGSGDFDADGMSDLVWRNYSSGENAIWYMNRTAYRSGVRFDSVADVNWRIVAVADFDSDRQPDLLWRHSTTGANSLWLMNGAVVKSYATLNAAPPDWRVGGAGDFNADGRVDIVWRNGSTGENALWFMNGATYLSGTRILSVADPNWEIAGVADMNLDGHSDLLWRNYVTGANSWWLMTGATYTTGISALSVSDPAWKLAAPR